MSTIAPRVLGVSAPITFRPRQDGSPQGCPLVSPLPSPRWLVGAQDHVDWRARAQRSAAFAGLAQGRTRGTARVRDAALGHRLVVFQPSRSPRRTDMVVEQLHPTTAVIGLGNIGSA